MQIHELPSGTVSNADYVAIDNGESTRKALVQNIDMSNNEVAFTSGDSETPTAWESVALITTGALSTLMANLSKIAKNVRFLWQKIGNVTMGTTATTVTGAIAEHEGDLTALSSSVNANAGAIVTLNSNLDALITTGRWTPKVYDLDTYKLDLAEHTYYKVGSLYIMPLYITGGISLSGISTMLQIRNLPCATLLGSSAIYMAGLTSLRQGADITVQRALGAIYFRPNITSSTASNTGLLSCVLIGI